MKKKIVSSSLGKEPSGQGGILFLLISVLSLLTLGLFMVWLNIERTKLAYTYQSIVEQVALVEETHRKLLVERDYLLAPQQLGKRANMMGLHIAKPSQIRRVTKDDMRRMINNRR